MKLIYLLVATLFIQTSLFANTATIKRSNGEILVNSIAVTKDQSLKAGDIIEVKGKGSFAQIVFENGDVVRMTKGKTKLKVFTKEKTSFNLYSGIIFVFVDKLKKMKRKFRVNTKNASMGVRGTKFFVTEVKDKPTYLCVCQGAVDIMNDKKKYVTVNQDMDLHVSKNEKMSTPINANKMMLEMGAMTFKMMGHPVVNKSIFL